ncbi:MAG: fluoride efflux transporter FluC [Actinomycetota bacterium]
MRPRILLAVALGGGLGACARYELELTFAPTTPPAFPWGTLAINLSGAFALGLLLTLILDVWPPTRYARPFVGIGILGGFTTFSTFVVESARLTGGGQAALALGYVAVSLVGGVMACGLGYAVAVTWGRRRLGGRARR